ncbi:uncharacterized protein LOC135930260 [Gordionus sp. m RMFG-2023]|uniref:uncharacterized protein LOC135930260 n=1 Tax=Gordionus sp. m RMFG-2023 TaxID=3053472 RepID=UPI0031FCBB15
MHKLNGKLLISSLNINGLRDKLAILLKMMTDEKIDIITIHETHSQGNTYATFNHFILYGSGTTLNSWSGVGFLINKKIYNYIVKFIPISERCGLLYVNTNFRPTILVNIYAPPKRRDRLHFLDDLGNIINTLPKRYNIILMGDLNTRIGLEESYIRRGIIGNASIVQPNCEDSRKILDLCSSKNLTIENTFFSHREVDTFTFKRGGYRSQIDFFISNVHWWFKDVVAMRSINISDHRMIKAKIWIRNLWRVSAGPSYTPHQPTNGLRRQSIRNLQMPEIRDLFDQKLREKVTRFVNISKFNTLEECWMLFKGDIHEASKVLVTNNSLARNEWISTNTLQKIEELRSSNCFDRELWKIIQRSLRSDRRIFTARKAYEIDVDMRGNRLFDAYNKLKHFCKSKIFRELPSIRLDNNKVIFDQDDQMALWTDYYMNIFESRKPVRLTCEQYTSSQSTSQFTLNEITTALKKLKNHKAPGLR